MILLINSYNKSRFLPTTPYPIPTKKSTLILWNNCIYLPFQMGSPEKPTKKKGILNNGNETRFHRLILTFNNIKKILIISRNLNRIVSRRDAKGDWQKECKKEQSGFLRRIEEAICKKLRERKRERREMNNLNFILGLCIWATLPVISNPLK